MEIVWVSNREELDYLYSVSALTIEGLDVSSISDIMEILKNNTAVYRERAFIIPGKIMNEQYGLTGTNAYKDYLPIVSFSLEDFDPMPMTFKRMEFGGRWFDDVVDNNARRERSKKNKA